MKNQKEYRNLPCKLTVEELVKKRDEVANLIREHERIDAERKEHSARLGQQLKEHMAEIRRLASEIEAKEEIREVLVLRETDQRAGSTQVMRQDTGEILEARKLRPDERQGAMFDA